jgi:hypothetical protein
VRATSRTSNASPRSRRKRATSGSVTLFPLVRSCNAYIGIQELFSRIAGVIDVGRTPIGVPALTSEIMLHFCHDAPKQRVGWAARRSPELGGRSPVARRELGGRSPGARWSLNRPAVAARPAK